jgi:hypothetical protein
VVEGLLPDSARHFQSSDADVQRSPTQFVVTGKLEHSTESRRRIFDSWLPSQQKLPNSAFRRLR